MTWVLYVDVAVGLVLALGFLAMAIVAGREAPAHKALWVVAVSLLVVRALFSLSIGMGVLFTSDSTWSFAIGATALALFIPTAVLRPRWAGIGLLISAVLQPALLFVLGRLAGVAEQEFPVEVMLAFYSLTVSIIGGLLILSTARWGRQEGEQPADVHAPAEPVSGGGADQR